ncbi:hypothetical protein BRC91_05745 [Halobacteriales archaeon QS_4_62_28]|nr:MAG: hypothetical protein BRC91_05745 [Halobacteriales archaeon QS_4_62_28]
MATDEESSGTVIEQSVELSERVIRGIEIAAAFVLVVLFGIGVLDLSGQIVAAVLDGTISDPLVVVGFIDTALLLFIIVEVYQTVVAYVRSNDTRRIVRLVILTGVIALVRKAIVFRTGEYSSEQAALTAAVAYTLLIAGLALLLYVSQSTMTVQQTSTDG